MSLLVEQLSEQVSFMLVGGLWVSHQGDVAGTGGNRVLGYWAHWLGSRHQAPWEVLDTEPRSCWGAEAGPYLA